MGKQKVLVLLSGGLDSTLVTHILSDLGLCVEALHLTTPFCLCDRCSVNKVVESLGIKLHVIIAGQDYLDLITDPPHGYGSQMNPCLDCRIYMFKKAKILAEKIEAEFIATGEVLNERGFSQRKKAMFLIEKEAGLEGKILRPLSAKLLPATELENKNMIDRNRLYAIEGKRRTPQIQLAEKYNIKNYPCPAGGCLLTDINFARRLRDFFEHKDALTLKDVMFLKIGRHFRVGNSKIIVGRNEKENEKLLHLAEKNGIPYLETIGYNGPITLLMNSNNQSNMIKHAASITVRYSDASDVAEVMYKGKTEQKITIRAQNDDERLKWRINV